MGLFSDVSARNVGLGSCGAYLVGRVIDANVAHFVSHDFCQGKIVNARYWRLIARHHVLIRVNCTWNRGETDCAMVYTGFGGRYL